MKKYKIGFVQGSFDMFHIGHLDILEQAKKMCDYLIVGVNSDEFMYSYKKKHPVIPLEERLAIVKAIKYVDEVHIMNDRDKLNALNKFHFNAIIMGDDYKGTEFYNKVEKQMKDKGVSIVYIPHIKLSSSTIIREKISKY